MLLTSTSISADETIGQKYLAPDCGGQNVSPELSWTGAPAGTRSFAITCYDPDAPTGSGFWHWIAFDIAADATSVPEGGSASLDVRQWMNDYGDDGYGGPCPPPGPAHRYIFTVYALDVPTLDVPDAATSAQARFTLHAHILDQASLTALYGLSQ